jgi:hypothetical protein
MRPPIFVGQRNVFCTLLQVPTRLHGDSRSLNSFTAPIHLQKAIKYFCKTMKKFVISFVGYRYI